MKTSLPGIRGVLFDKDGTLFDFCSMWMPAYRAAVEYLARLTGIEQQQQLLQVAGYDPEAGQVRAGSLLASATTAEIAALWLEQVGLSEHVEARARILEIFHQHAIQAPHPTVDLDALFTALRTRGIVLGVATMDSTASALEGLAALGVSASLDFVAGFDAGFGVKPEPGMVHAFSRAVGLPMDAIAVVGDSVSDLEMGRAAGVGLCVGVLTGTAVYSDLGPVADVVLDDVSTLPVVLA